MTSLIALFSATGYIEGQAPQSLLLCGQPGRGKSELLLRFRHNPFMAFRSDLTVRGLYPILRAAKRHACSHVVALELQKYFLRKEAVANNLMSTLALAMSEGVGKINIGGRDEDFGGAQIGMIGAITKNTMARRGAYLDELGFLDRATVIQWDLDDAAIKEILKRMTSGDRSDLRPVLLPVPEDRVKITLPVTVGRKVERYVWARWRTDALRPIGRLRALTMAAALLEGRHTVALRDWERIESYDDIWQKVAE